MYLCNRTRISCAIVLSAYFGASLASADAESNCISVSVMDINGGNRIAWEFVISDGSEGRWLKGAGRDYLPDGSPRGNVTTVYIGAEGQLPESRKLASDLSVLANDALLYVAETAGESRALAISGDRTRVLLVRGQAECMQGQSMHDVASRLALILLPDPHGRGIGCVPDYSECHNNAAKACRPLGFSLKYSCNPQTGAVLCEWTCCSECGGKR